MDKINTLNHLSFDLKMQLAEIEMIIREIDKFYYTKKEPKKDKNGNIKLKNGVAQIRTLHPSTGRLKVLQKRIKSSLLNRISLPDYAYGGIKGKDNVRNAKVHQGKKFIFTTDLSDFFPSIRNPLVFRMFRSFDYSPTVSRYLTKLTTYKGKLPQGAPTSPLIANLVFVKTGKRLNELAKEHNLTFTTFIDDLTFSSPIDFKEIVPQIIEAIKEDGFRISHKKTSYKTKNPIVTGVVVKNNNLDLSNELKNKLLLTEGRSDAQIKGLKQYANRVINF